MGGQGSCWELIKETPDHLSPTHLRPLDKYKARELYPGSNYSSDLAFVTFNPGFQSINLQVNRKNNLDSIRVIRCFKDIVYE
jgi:hypothetical protein